MGRVATASLVVMLALLCAGSAHGSVWVEAYGGTRADVVRAVVGTSDGGTAVAGYCRELDGSSAREPFLAHFDGDGNLVWCRRLYSSSTYSGEFLSVVETGDHDLVAVGYTTRFGDASDTVIARYRLSDGVADWVRHWGAGDDEDEALHDVIEASTGTLWAVGSTRSYLPVGREKILVARIDPAGTQMTCARVGKLTANWHVSGVGIVEVFDTDGVCVVGTLEERTLSGAVTDRDVLLAKFSHAPEYLFALSIGVDAAYEEGTALVRTTDRGIAVAGSSREGSGFASPFVAKLDADLDFSWGRMEAGGPIVPGVGSITDIIETSPAAGGGLVAVGEGWSASGHDIYATSWTLSGAGRWTTSFPGAVGALWGLGWSLDEVQDGHIAVAGATDAYGAGAADALVCIISGEGESCLNEQAGPGFGTSYAPPVSAVILAADNAYTVPTSAWPVTAVAAYGMATDLVCYVDEGPEPCVRIDRCADDLRQSYSYSTPTYRVDEWTAGVHDGEGYLDGGQGRVGFLLDMRGEEAWLHGQAWMVRHYGFGLLTIYDSASCNAVRTIRLPEFGPFEPAPHYYGLASDDRTGGFWYSRPCLPQADPPLPPGTAVSHITSGGIVLGDGFGIVGFFVVALALDPVDGHLWCGGTDESGNDVLLEYDVSGPTATLIQGPLLVPWSSPGGAGIAGLDYDDARDELIAVNLATRTKEVFADLLSQGGVGGVRLEGACLIQETPDPFGIALPADGLEGVFVAGGREGGAAPLDIYEYLPTNVTGEQAVAGCPILAPACPNPFNPTTSIAYAAGDGGRATIVVYNAAGRKVRTLLDADLSAGASGRVVWDGTSEAGGACPSGVYFCRMVVGGAAATRKLVVVK